MPYGGDPTLKAQGEKTRITENRLKEFIRCKEDILYFTENYFYIVDIDKGKHKIKLREYQKRMLKAFVSPAKGKRHIAMLSARQVGKTTISTVYLTHYALFQEDKTVALLANKEKTAVEILRRIKLAIQNIPLWLQQGISEANGGWNKGAIGFENGVRIIAGSTASSAIRGEAISLLYLDEFAFVPDNIADDFMRSVYPTVSSSKTSKIIIVSTPCGLNHYYHIWRGAIERDPKRANNFMPVKINWDEVPGRDKKWKESIIRDVGPQTFAQEYGCKFLGSSNTLIDPELLERISIRDPIDYSHLGNYLNIFEYPIKGELYILGIDSSKGTGKDYSVIQVLRIIHKHKIKQVAVYARNNINAYEFAQVCISVSEYYNECYMMVENNEVGGTVADTIWYTYEYDKIINCDKKGIGIRSTKTTKLAGNVLLKRYIDSGWLEIIERKTVYELSRYEEIRPNIFQAPRGQNDDHVMALIWALYFTTTLFFDGKTLKVIKIEDEFKINPDAQEDDMPIMFYDDDTIDEYVESRGTSNFDDLEEGWGYREGIDENLDGYVL